MANKEGEYRRNAAATVDLAHRACSTADKSRRLALAEAWLKLAEHAHQIASHHPRMSLREHPLLREKLRPRPDA
jgi:hypothetical protein